MSDYNKKLLSHFLNPYNIGIIQNADGYGFANNPVNGYRTDIYIKIENGKISDIKFKTIGCTATIASASALTKIVKNKSLDEIINRENPFENLLDMLINEIGDVPKKNWHCPPTAIKILFIAICNYYENKNDQKDVNKIEKIIKYINNFFYRKLNEN